MKPKAVVKIVVDIGMTVGLLRQMGYQFWGDVAHEWTGAGMFCLFIIHHLLNLGWYKSLFYGKYTPARIFQLTANLLVTLAMLGLMVSGVMLSQHVFDFLPIDGSMSFARLLHVAAQNWGFVLMAFHIGVHWNGIMGMLRRAAGIRKVSRAGAAWPALLGAGIAVYGLYVFFKRHILSYMFLREEFVFLDFGEPIPLFYLDYLAVMELFVFLAHFCSKGLRNRKISQREVTE